MNHSKKESNCPTRVIFSLYKLFESPLGSLFNIFLIILYNLEASPVQMLVAISSKPVVALLSFYGNLFIKNKSSQLKLMILASVLLGSIPCLFFPLINNLWFMIIAYALFTLSLKAAAPAWSEILKINLPIEPRHKVFSRGSIFHYATNIVVPLLISPLLDGYPDIWKWLFFGFALLNTLNIFLILKLKLQAHIQEADILPNYQLNSLSSIVLDPWRHGLKLIKERADFKHFQIVFMLCGTGLMLIQPALPSLLKGTLELSYFKLTLATSFCKGISFVLSSSIWAHYLSRISINLFNFYICCFATMFSLFMIGSQYLTPSIYLAYLFYGIMQAGSEMSWNLAGPIFAKNKDSTLYTAVNVAAVGIRGCVAPFLGSLLFFSTQSITAVFACCGSLCLMASLYSVWVFMQSEEKQTPLTR